VKLLVHHLSEHEVYRDIARIPEEYRKDVHGQRVDRGNVCELLCKETGNKAFVVLYGSRREGAHIGVDNRTRRKLDIKPDHSYEFELISSGFWGEVRWALESGDVVHRFSSRIALVSLILGLAGIALGILSVYLSLR
jgi:hypothetical protein